MKDFNLNPIINQTNYSMLTEPIKAEFKKVREKLDKLFALQEKILQVYEKGNKS